jgi:hypothetical protein
MYYSMTECYGDSKPTTHYKLVTAGPEEKVVGLHMYVSIIFFIVL